jgi:hypothetical protein
MRSPGAARRNSTAFCGSDEWSKLLKFIDSRHSARCQSGNQSEAEHDKCRNPRESAQQGHTRIFGARICGRKREGGIYRGVSCE